ncbi:unnamed protein product [Bemisia tabaci]|uniref:Peptidase C1A papain C-terminal domain-containing protein n=1 Tax=Bemisia tabaci TaxID=7038 RepID=A0A9P0G459_BEMTA|nr:unnamed protein product [Bemisia tabaci]
MMDSSAEAPEVEEEEEGGAKRGRTNGRHRDRLKLRNTNSTWVSDKFIAAINSKQTEWKAGRNFRADIRSKVLKRLVGERLGSSISWSQKFHSILPSAWTTLKGALMSYTVTPESYDLRDETDCVMRPLDTGLAATSWALSTAQSVEDRWCGTMSASRERTFSSQYLINCCDACTDQSSTNAGSPMEAYNFMQRIGIPGKDCKPYSSSPVMRTLGADAVSTKVRVPRIVNGCSSECDESDLPFVFTDLCKIRSFHYIVPGWASSIKHEIRNRGSVTAEVTVYTDFLNYKEGVYSPVEGAEPFGDLTLRLIGWNGSHSQLHWLAVGVWGRKWGDRGMVKLKAFDPRLNMESRVSVGTVDGAQCKEAQQPEVTGSP